MTPGTVCNTTHGLRDDGIFCSSSSETFVDTVSLRVSTIGVSALTVSEAVTPPTDIVAFSTTL